MRRAAVLGFSVAVLAAVGAGVYAYAMRKGDAPTGLVVTPNPMELGEVELGDPRQVTVTIENHGKTAALLRDPTFNCPCFFLVSHPTMNLRPGDKTSFQMRMEPSKTAPGVFHKEMLVISGGVEVKVPITGEVMDYYHADKNVLEFGAVDAAKGAAPQKVEIRDGTGFSARAVDAASSDLRFDVEVVPADHGSDVVVTPRPSPSSAKEHVEAEITVNISVTGRGRAPVTKWGIFRVRAEMR